MHIDEMIQSQIQQIQERNLTPVSVTVNEAHFTWLQARHDTLCRYYSTLPAIDVYAGFPLLKMLGDGDPIVSFKQ